MSSLALASRLVPGTFELTLSNANDFIENECTLSALFVVCCIEDHHILMQIWLAGANFINESDYNSNVRRNEFCCEKENQFQGLAESVGSIRFGLGLFSVPSIFTLSSRQIMAKLWLELCPS